CPVFRDIQTTNSFASSQLTLMTGRSPRPHPRSWGRDLHPPSSTHLSHSLNVTSRRPTAKFLEMLTRCTGFSYSDEDPIANEPAGTTAISGQSGQSRKTSPGLDPDRGESRGGGVETVGELLEVVEVPGDGGDGWGDGAGAGVITAELDGLK